MQLETLNSRNTVAVEQALKDMYERIYEQAEQIQMQQDTIGTVIERLTVMEQMLMAQQVRLAGHGPTGR